MKLRFIKILLILFVFASLLTPTGLNAQADTDVGAGTPLGLCTFIGPICTALGISTSTSGDDVRSTAISFGTDRVSQVVSLIFIGIIIISVFIIIQAGVKYIQSQGEEGKIAEAQKAIKSVFVGIAILFVGIIGLILVLAFFGGTGLLGGGDTVDQIFTAPGAQSGGSSGGGSGDDTLRARINACNICLDSTGNDSAICGGTNGPCQGL